MTILEWVIGCHAHEDAIYVGDSEKCSLSIYQLCGLMTWLNWHRSSIVYYVLTMLLPPGSIFLLGLGRLYRLPRGSSFGDVSILKTQHQLLGEIG